MRLDQLLQKLRPLMPTRVRKWERALDLLDPELRTLLEKHILSVAHRRLGDFRRKLLLSLPPKKTARGTLHLGTVLYDNEKWPAGISRPELLQNLAIFGRSGAGKTNIVFHLIRQLSAKRIPFLFLDWKRTARHLLPHLSRHTPLYTPGRTLAPFPFNPFLSPPSVEPRVFANQVVDVLADAYTLGDGARSILQKALCACYTKSRAPTLNRLLQQVRAIPDKERVRGWKISAIRALESLAGLALNTNSASQQQMVRTLLQQGSIVELDGLAPSGKKFLLPMLCLWLYYQQLATRRREDLQLVLIVEEAHHVFFDHRGIRESLMHMLLRQCREIGIGMIVIDQHPHRISSVALGNTYTTICLNLKDPKDIRTASNLCLMDPAQSHHLSTLPIGHGVVKLQDRWRQPFLVHFPLVPLQKGVVTDQLVQALSCKQLTLSGLKRRLPARIDALGHSRLTDTPLTTHHFHFLTDIQRFPNSGVSQRYRRLHLSADKGNRIKQQLLHAGILEAQTVRLGRTQRVLLRITRQAARNLGVKRNPQHHASIAHEYWKHYYATLYRQKGYRVQLEAPRNKGRADILATKATESVAIEIETGKSNVLWNVQQNLLSGFQRVLVVATDESALQKIERQLAQANLLLPSVIVALREGMQEYL